MNMWKEKDENGEIKTTTQYPNCRANLRPFFFILENKQTKILFLIEFLFRNAIFVLIVSDVKILLTHQTSLMVYIVSDESSFYRI